MGASAVAQATPRARLYAPFAEHTRAATHPRPGARRGRRLGDGQKTASGNGLWVALGSAGVRTRITACPRPPFAYNNRPSRLAGRREALKASVVVGLGSVW